MVKMKPPVFLIFFITNQLKQLIKKVKPRRKMMTGISCYFDDLVNLDFRITLNIRSSGKKSNDELLNSSKNESVQNFKK